MNAAADPKAPDKKKAIRTSEWPKSREETPKEGCNQRAKLAHVAMQKLRVHRTNYKCNFCKSVADVAQSSEIFGLFKGQNCQCAADFGRNAQGALDHAIAHKERPFERRTAQV